LMMALALPTESTAKLQASLCLDGVFFSSNAGVVLLVSGCSLDSKASSGFLSLRVGCRSLYPLSQCLTDSIVISAAAGGSRANRNCLRCHARLILIPFGVADLTFHHLISVGAEIWQLKLKTFVLDELTRSRLTDVVYLLTSSLKGSKSS
jgi:hypothetical protein